MIRVFQFMVLGLVADPAAAEIFKCVDAEGQVSYQATACPEQQKQQPVRVVDRPTLSSYEHWRAAIYNGRIDPPEYAVPPPQDPPDVHRAAPVSSGLPQPLPVSPPDGVAGHMCIEEDGERYLSTRGCPGDQQRLRDKFGTTSSPSRSVPAEGSPQPVNAAIDGSGANHDGTDAAKVNGRRDPCIEAKAQRTAQRRDMNLDDAQLLQLDEQVGRACAGGG